MSTGMKVFWLSLISVISWGIVPAFAKLGNLSGAATTMWVNWITVITVLVIMMVNGSWREFLKPQPYAKMIVWGMVWPLAYSLAYFGAIKVGGGAITTIANYTWPLWYLILGYLYRDRFPARSWLFISLIFLGVALPLVLEGNVNFSYAAFGLGLVAAAFQALYSRMTNKSTENPWLVTLIVCLVTSVGATLWVLATEKFVLPPTQIYFYLVVLGAISGGIGFYTFLVANQLSSNDQRLKVNFFGLLALTPMVQVFMLPILEVEAVSPVRWLGVVAIFVALLIFNFQRAKS